MSTKRSDVASKPHGKTSPSRSRPKSAVGTERYEKDFLRKLLYEMLLIRRFEEKAAQMYGLRKIGGFCHLCNGQEAVSVGSIAALDLEKDYVVTAYRDHGHALACGIEPKAVMAELYGKITGCSRGKGGSMHLFDASKHMLGGNGIVGAQIPVAAGVAFKIRYRKEDGVVLCYFGDGAIHQGSFHESMNLAAIWKLPIIFICENNQFGMGTRFDRVSSVQDFSLMGTSYGIPGRQVDGMNVLTVYEEVNRAVQLAKKEGQPNFLEIKTYRYKGHSMSDPATYRTREEVDDFKKQDPIVILQTLLEKEGMLTSERFEKMDAECREICNQAVTFAEESPEPTPETLYEDVLV